MRDSNIKLYKTSICIILILLTPTIVFSINKEDLTGYDSHFKAKMPCWTQAQQSCLFSKLIPFILITLTFMIVSYLKFEKRISKIPTRRKVILFLLFLGIFYFTCALLLKFFFAKYCL